jgi:capsular exopolysaccharide synthesis family protein
LIFLIVLLLPATVYVVDEHFRPKIHLAQAPFQLLDAGESMVVKLGLREIRQREQDMTNVEALLHEPKVLEELRGRLREVLSGAAEELSELERSQLASLVGEEGDPLQPDFERRCGMIAAAVDADGGGVLFVRGSAPGLHRLVAEHLIPAMNRYAQLSRAKSIRQFQREQQDLLGTKRRKLEGILRDLRQVNLAIRKANGTLEGARTERDYRHLQKSPIQLRREQIELELLELTLQHERLKSESGWANLRKMYALKDERDIRYALVAGNPLREAWRALVKKRGALARRYTAEHPAMRSLADEEKGLLTQLKKADGQTSLGRVPPLPALHDEKQLEAIRSLHRKMVLTRDRLEAIRRREGVTDTAPAPPKQEALSAKEQEALFNQLQDLEQQKEALKSRQRMQLSSVLTLYNSLDETQLLIHQVDTEEIYRSLGPTRVRLESPRVVLDVTLAVILGLVIGVAAAFLLESVDNRLHTPFDVYYHLRLNYLGVVPHWTEADARVIAPDKPDSHIAEIYAHLRTNIRYSRPTSPEKVLMIASATQGEGKSTVSANLAISYALEGNSVILIDGDLRRPRSHKLIEVLESGRSVRYGLADFLTGESTFEESVYTTTVPGLSLLPAGGKVRNPAKLMGSAGMRGLIQEAEARYDIVILDCPAVLPVVDAATMAGHVRGVLMVIAAEEVEVGAVRMALYRLKHVGSPIIGAVLNKVRERSTSYYYYGTRYRGGYSYGPYRRPYATDEAYDIDQDDPYESGA